MAQAGKPVLVIEDEARINLEEAIQLVLEANRLLAQEQNQGQDLIRESMFLSVV